jgi:hypothetical protein
MALMKINSNYFLGSLIITLIIILLMGENVNATTYYIDFQNGNDSNNGTSMSTAFKHCPGDGNGENVAKNTIVNAGDFLIFKGGVEYIGQIVVTRSGASGTPIVYDGNSNGSWGTGRAILSGDSMVYSSGFDLSSGRSFINIVNFEINGQKSLGINLANGQNILIKDCYIHDISDWKLANCLPGGQPNCDENYVANLGVGIYIPGKWYNITIDNIEIKKTGHGGIVVSNSSGDNLEIKNCKIHDYIHWMLDIAPSVGGLISNVYIHNNKFFNLYHYSSQYWNGEIKDEKINYGAGENPHQDGIFIRNPLVGTTTNIRVYNNDFYNEVQFTGNGGTAMLYVSEPRTINDTIYIYNNVFQGCYPYDAVALLFLYGGDIYIYNNSWYMQQKNALRMEAPSGSTTRVYIKNNIFDISSGGYALRLTNSNTAQKVNSDYNIYKQSGPYIIWDGKFYSSLYSWKISGYGQDLNSISVNDVGYVSPRNMKISGTSILKIEETSPARTKGVDLGSSFGIDKAGLSRPQGGNWDIGAYQYSPTLAPPRNLKITE